MKLSRLLQWASDKTKFTAISDYADFCREYLAFARDGLQAVIVSQNENHYRFYQYRADGSYNVTRPINNNLMIPIDAFDETVRVFTYALSHIKEIAENKENRNCINHFVYTCQQSIGAALDALPSGGSNAARKLNGDLFERFIRLIISEMGISVRDGTVKIPVVVDGDELFSMSYQHDLIIEQNESLRAIGSVKTSSKDRLDKVFIDKFLHNRLTGIDTPHFAVFLNDVQRKGREPRYGVNSTFLAGRFKGYTIKLNPLDGIYYCDIRPVMRNDALLNRHIKTLDHLLVEDIWDF
ncbi:MAG: hypothetical protein FWG72_07520 [Oscillospiraceae bacterium]|nr:hypothetical protein [Oscillospiraceae bacterium]